MAKPRAKKSASGLEALRWSTREVVEPGTPVGPVTCSAGCIVFAGASLYRIPPKTWTVQYRGLPETTDLPLSIAMEPRPPFRVAVGPETGDVVIFTDTSTSSSIMVHGFSEQRGAKQAAQLAWVEHEGQSSLFARTLDGGLFRMQAEGFDELEVPPVRAIAQDDEGTFAALTVVDGNPKVIVSPDGGDSWFLRPLGVEVEAEPDAPAYLALAGTALAVVVGDSGPFVSRAPGKRTERHAGHDGLSRAYAMAFAGSDPGVPLYVALRRTEAEPAAVSLMAPDGSVLRVMDFVCDDMEPLELGAITWDSARRSLLVVSRGGLLAVSPEAPRPKRVRKKKEAPLPQ
jgi:hypothetical protein